MAYVFFFAVTFLGIMFFSHKSKNPVGPKLGPVFCQKGTKLVWQRYQIPSLIHSYENATIKTNLTTDFTNRQKFV